MRLIQKTEVLIESLNVNKTVIEIDLGNDIVTGRGKKKCLEKGSRRFHPQSSCYSLLHALNSTNYVNSASM